MDHFVVSARKYRPQTFVTVVGQGHITSTLKNAISRNQLAHAYLFTGPRGVGKTTCARIFAKSINCLSPLDSEACGQCESCRAFDQERSFNIHELDAASNNSVEDIRTLTEQVRIPPQIGRYSVYIIDEVHMLSAAAFNAFLKTLEEPPAHAVFILATTEKHKIIPTILSRCQIYDFNRIRVEDGVTYLKYVAGEEGVTFDDESLNLIARKADGGMRDALSMFDKAVSFCGNSLEYKSVARTLNVLDYDTYFSITDLILAGEYPAVLLAFDEVLGKGFTGQTFMAGMGEHFRDLLMCKNPQTIALLEITGSLLDRYKQQAVRCQVDLLFNAIATLTELESSFRTALNQRLHVELGLMKLCGMGQKKSLNSNESLAVLPDLELNRVLHGNAGEAAIAVTPTEHAVAVTPTERAAASAKPAVQPVSAEPIVAVSATHVQPEPHATAPKPEPVAAPRSLTGGLPSSISGDSIASIMNGPKRNGVSENMLDKQTDAEVDPDAEKKILQFASRFLNSLQAERPRFAQAFTDMTVEGNKISVIANSQELHDEIMRNRAEILDMLAAIAGVSGILGLTVKLVETHGAKKPIKVEDRLKFLTDKNPLVTKLRKELDFEIE